MTSSPENLPTKASVLSVVTSKPKFLAVKFTPPKSTHTLEKPNLNFDETVPDTCSQNIFSVTKLIGSEFEITSKGPRLTAKGTILPYTILGRPEWFKNYFPAKDGNSVSKESEFRGQQNTTSSEAQETVKINRPMTANIGQTKIPVSSAQPHNRPFSSNLASERRSNDDTQKTLEKMPLVLKKEDVLEEINQIKQRVYLSRPKPKRRVPLSAKYFENKERKCLTHFDELEKKWEDQSKFYARKIERDHNDRPLYYKNESFRQKVEMAKVVENLQTDHEKFGDRYWELTLRKYEEVKALERISTVNKSIADFKQEALQKTTKPSQKDEDKVRPLSAQIEAIRNPKRQYKEMPFSSFKSDHYLKNKLQVFEEKVRDMHPMMKPDEINSLIIQGEDKCKKEIECLLDKLRSEDSQKAAYLKYKLPESVKEANMEETIQSAYSTRNLISKTGFYKNPYKSNKF